MRKRIVGIIIGILWLLLCSTTVFAASGTTVQVSPAKVQAGQSFTVSGTADAGEWVSIKGLDNDGNIVYFNTVKADLAGAWRETLKAPEMIPGILKIVAGSSIDVAATDLEIDTNSGNGNSTSSTTTATGATNTTTEGDTATTVISTTTSEAKCDANGKAEATVSTTQVADAVNQAAAEAAKQGEGFAAQVEIKVTAPACAKTVEVSIPAAAVSVVANNCTAGLTVSSQIACLTFDRNALDTISQAATGNVRITASNVGTAALSAETQRVIGDRPVFYFSVTSGSHTISQFGGNVEISVPYTAKAGEDTNAIVIYYIDAVGKAETVSNCKYDPATGTIAFKTNHFSMYAVGYNKVTFRDVAANAWYSKAVTFIAARGITTGTGKGKFSPEAAITRGQYLVMVMKAYGIKPDAKAKDNFADAGNTYYTGYLAAAKRLGLTNGIGSNLYAPNKEITQQEMVSLLYKTIKTFGELPAGKKGKELSDFADANQIASWAKDAMTLFVETGIISGSDVNLNLTAICSRAQMAQILYNVLSK